MTTSPWTGEPQNIVEEPDTIDTEMPDAPALPNPVDDLAEKFEGLKIGD